VAALDPVLAGHIEADFEKDLTQARRVTLDEWEHRGPFERAKEWVGWIIAREQ
jgi:hypothetical protein